MVNISEKYRFYDNVDGKLVPNEHVKYIDFIVDKLKQGVSANEVARLLNGKKKPPKIKIGIVKRL